MYSDLEYTLDNDDTANINLNDVAYFLLTHGFDLGVEVEEPNQILMKK